MNAPGFAAVSHACRYRDHSLRQNIIRRPEDAVRSRGADLGFGGGELVEEVGSAPGIGQFTLSIETEGFLRKIAHAFGISAIECFDDFGIGAHGVAAETLSEMAEMESYVFGLGPGRMIGWERWSGRGGWRRNGSADRRKGRRSGGCGMSY